MKHPILILCLCLFCIYGHTQTKTNTFPESGNVGIGLLYPAFELDIRSPEPRLQLYENSSGGYRRLQIHVGVNQEVRFLSTYGTGGNYPFTFRFGGSVGEAMRIATNGNVGIGTTTPTDKLSVNGRIRATEVKVETANWPDYVFHKDYALPSLSELDAYIRKEGHLPGMPTAKKAESEGVDLGEMNRKLLEKVEELTLHLIRLDMENAELRKQMQSLGKEVKTIKSTTN